MKVRGLALVVAVLLAIGATGAVYLYVQGVREDATTPAEMVTVIVAKEDIPAEAQLDTYISSGGFTTLSIPQDAIVQGAVTHLDQLKGQVTRYPILQGEQISLARFQDSAIQVKGGVLGIPPGMKAVTISFEAPQAVGGVVRAHDRVTVYATFDDVQLITPPLEQRLNNPNVKEKENSLGTFTVTVVPDVEVLKTNAAAAEGTSEAPEEVQLTMALTPADAQRVIFAQENGKVWLGLLPPNEEGTTEPPVQVLDVIGLPIR